MYRKVNSIKNLVTSTGSELLVMVLKFITRTIFINILGKEYLGINGLFTNILQMLSLTELGLASAINYQLYKPIAERNEERIRILMKFYKNAYRMIGIIIIGIGLCIIPFLPVLIRDYDTLEALGINAVFIFLLYLIQSASTYLFFAYKSALIRADQKEYKLTIASYGITVISYGTQILILLFWHNFVFYTASLIFFDIIQNVIFAHIVDKNYSFIRKKTSGKLTIREIKSLLRDCYALFIYKINQVVLNATDNIILSSFIGLAVVGEYSNYIMIYNQIKIIMIRCFNAIKASLGNFHAVEKVENEYLLFKAMNLFTIISYGSAAVGTIVVGDSFVATWIGEEYVLGDIFCILLGIEIYILGIRQLMGSYRETMGLFQQGKYRPMASIILNIIFSIALVRPLGLYGVMLGTILSDCMTMIWIDPLVLYRYGFKNYCPLRNYFIKNSIYLLVLVIAVILSKFLCGLFLTVGWGSVILKICISVFITCMLLCMISIRTEELKYIIKQVVGIVKSKGKINYNKIKG